MNTSQNASEEIKETGEELSSHTNSVKTNLEDLLFDNILMQNLSYEQITKIFGDSKSLLAKHLTEEVFNEYKNLSTSGGVTLFDIIKGGVIRPVCKIGVYAGDAESYVTFEKLFAPMIEEFHGVSSDTKYTGGLDPITTNLELDPESYGDIRMRMGANLKGRFPSKQTLEDRKQVESDVSSLLEKEFGGKYFSAKETASEQWKEWQKKGYGFALEDEYLEEAGIITDFWPEGSGIWMDNPEAPSTIIIVNEEDHIRFTGFGKDVQSIYKKISDIYNHLDENLSFAKHEQYGNLGSCPSNIGHMFKTGIRISFPNLQAKVSLDDLKVIAKEYGCEIRGQGGEMSKTFDVIEVSNSKRFMPAQEAVEKWTTLLNLLTKMESEYKAEANQ